MSRASSESGARTRRARRREPTEDIPWRLLQDDRMSYRAQGVLTNLLSRPDDWRASATRLAKGRKEGRDAVEAALRELDACGYLFRKRVQYTTGQWGWVWIYGDDPAAVAEDAADELRAIAAGEITAA